LFVVLLLTISSRCAGPSLAEAGAAAVAAAAGVATAVAAVAVAAVAVAARLAAPEASMVKEKQPPVHLL